MEFICTTTQLKGHKHAKENVYANYKTHIAGLCNYSPMDSWNYLDKEPRRPYQLPTCKRCLVKILPKLAYNQKNSPNKVYELKLEIINKETYIQLIDTLGQVQYQTKDIYEMECYLRKYGYIETIH